jgi:hypothetical protein
MKNSHETRIDHFTQSILSSLVAFIQNIECAEKKLPKTAR